MDQVVGHHDARLLLYQSHRVAGGVREVAGGAGGECAARHMQIIYYINWRFTQELRGIMGDDYDRIGRMSIIEEGEGFDKSVRMAHLALVASHTVNGVAAIHSELIKTTIFKEFYDAMPEKFQNKTNGVTQRRWLAFCNPRSRRSSPRRSAPTRG